ncbi:MAG: hypothetical protein K8F90_12890, partial [Hyphomicrobiales bacterium]|nr:hypothetical protein [Hyphomicrobiales bacterium]
MSVGQSFAHGYAGGGSGYAVSGAGERSEGLRERSLRRSAGRVVRRLTQTASTLLRRFRLPVRTSALSSSD